MIKVGIIGGTGYTGAELLRLINQHPQADVVSITSRAEAGVPVAERFPSLRGLTKLSFQDPVEASLTQCDVVFCATPNGVAMNSAAELLSENVKVVDLSADFRIQDLSVWQQWYGMEHGSPELVSQAVYGLPEVNREKIKLASLVANPGCYPTAIQLGFLPVIEAGLADTSNLIANAASGVSGAGRTANVAFNFCEVGDSFKAYAASGHRHLPEIRQGLQLAAGVAVGLTFVPHLLPMIRGIHATLYMTVKDRSVDLQKLFESRYKDEPYVDVLPWGSHPDTRSVRGGNSVRLACHRPQNGDVVVVLAAEDNLVKGAAGQAIQNMNLMFDLQETSGLSAGGLTP
ncbi:MAG: N-acetyl-gamma-glutamyl-phosphate reductase [Gammaproteobacteria bacterium]|jgi:N-acetyl-gamma-glutamyl-phosphate reductase